MCFTVARCIFAIWSIGLCTSHVAVAKSTVATLVTCTHPLRESDTYTLILPTRNSLDNDWQVHLETWKTHAQQAREIRFGPWADYATVFQRYLGMRTAGHPLRACFFNCRSPDPLRTPCTSDTGCPSVAL